MPESTPTAPNVSPPAAADPSIRFQGVSRWYGEVLGVNKVTADLYPGITGLVGPNGSGKSTLMNLLCGMLRPGQGEAFALGQRAWNNPELRRRMGYCMQADQFYENFTGRQFLEMLLALHGNGRDWTRRTADSALELVEMAEHAGRKIRTYSKGMRQRIKIALAISHEPEVLVLDEPFNGLDPVGRHRMMQLFAQYARDGRTVIISSHILHEIEQMTDRVLMMSNGYVMAEGEVRQVRDLLRKHPFKVLVRCDRPRRLAALVLENDSAISISLEDDRSMTLETRDPDRFYLLLNHLVIEHGFDVDLVTLADENVQSLYQYLVGREHH